MIVTLPTSKLKEILELASRFVAKHSTLPVLENIYIKADIDNIVFRATDMEKYIQLSLPVKVDAEWAITVNAKMFLDIIKVIEEEEIKLVIDQQKDVLNIKTKTDDFKIKGIPASEYVALPTIETQQGYTINISDFLKWVEKVYFAVTEKAFSPVLTGVLLRLKAEEKKMIFVWTDSFRLAEYKLDYVYELDKDIDLIIPKVNVGEIIRVFDYVNSKDQNEATMKFSENLVSFSTKAEDIDIDVASLLIQWDFPNYENENVIPTQFNTKILVDANLLEKAIKKVVILTQSENYFVEIKNETPDQLIITSWLTDLWESITRIPANIEWSNIDLGINGRYILDFIKALSSDQLNMNVVSEERPVVFKDVQDPNYTYVVRPLVK